MPLVFVTFFHFYIQFQQTTEIIDSNVKSGLFLDHVMEFVIGIKGKDFVLLGADQSAMRSVIVYQQELDKIHQISKNTGLAGINK